MLSYKKKGCITSICRVKVVIINDCHCFDIRFRFHKKNKISRAKANKKAEIGSL